MRLEVKKWSLIRLVRLIVGLIGTIQGILIGEVALSIFAFLLVYMALAVKPSEKVELELEEVRPRI
ncbi:MAG TPA: hypothetical protein VI385_04410 [Flavisolibacter sp.]|jgi:hypothetical protein